MCSESVSAMTSSISTQMRCTEDSPGLLLSNRLAVRSSEMVSERTGVLHPARQNFPMLFEREKTNVAAVVLHDLSAGYGSRLRPGGVFARRGRRRERLQVVALSERAAWRDPNREIGCNYRR